MSRRNAVLAVDLVLVQTVHDDGTPEIPRLIKRCKIRVDRKEIQEFSADIRASLNRPDQVRGVLSTCSARISGFEFSDHCRSMPAGFLHAQARSHWPSQSNASSSICKTGSFLRGRVHRAGTNPIERLVQHLAAIALRSPGMQQIRRINHNLQPRRTNFIQQPPRSHHRADDIIDLRLERQRDLMPISDRNRRAHRLDQPFPRALARSYPDAISTCRAGRASPCTA